MAEFNFLTKEIGMTAEELEGAVRSGIVHNADEVSHINADEREKWNDAATQHISITATTEAEVLKALEIARNSPGCYVALKLAAGVCATVPTMYLYNVVLSITGTQTDGANTNVLTFAQTGTTSNLHFQGSSVYLISVTLRGNLTKSTGGYGVLRAEYGSKLYCNKVTFQQAEGSADFGNNIEVRDVSDCFVANCVFRSVSTNSSAAAVYANSGSNATIRNCSFAGDSTVQTIARMEIGARVNQIGTTFDVLRPAGHASEYRIDGVEQE